MSDYLTRLVEGARGAPPQLQPLIASIHAPGGRMLVQTNEYGAANADEVEEPAALIGPTTAIMQRLPGADGVPSQPRMSRADPQPLPDQSAPTSVPPTRTDDRSVVPVLSSVAAGAVGPVPNVLVKRTLTQLIPPRDRLLSRRSEVSRGNRSTPTTARPQVSGRRTTASEETRFDQPKQTSPTIRVTIGRVDVRAIMSPPSPAPAQTQRTEPRHLSLEDYLRGRRNGDVQ